MPRQVKKHMRLPNGFGSITKISNKRLRKPYYARVTIGKTPEGRPILRSLKPAYYETYNDAYSALMKYHEDPYILSKNITMDELFNKWFPIYMEEKDNKSKHRSEMKHAWEYLSSIHNVEVSMIRIPAMKSAIMHSAEKKGDRVIPSTPIVKKRLKMLLNQLLDYAVECDLINSNYARMFKLPDKIYQEEKNNRKGHIVFKDDELKILWKHKEDLVSDIILVQCYMGWRPIEVLRIENENINWNDFTIIGGTKTNAGSNRTVPMMPCIRDIIRKYYDEGNKYLFHNSKGLPITYDRYKKRFCRSNVKIWT